MGNVHTFLVDETNRNYVENHFFIVGGLVYTPEQIGPVNDAIVRVRREAGYLAGDSLKFNTNERPDYISPATHRDAKKLVVSALKDIGVRMIVSVVLHDLCRNQSYDERMNWALNTVTGAYSRLLASENTHGIMLMDRDNDRFDHLEYLFQHGLKMSNRHVRVDNRIMLFGMTNDNASNLSSAADIALGAFRYCLNTAVGDGREPVAREMFPDLTEIMWANDLGGGAKLYAGYGYHPRPQLEKIRVVAHRARYDNLAAALNSYSIESLDVSALPTGQ
ncbi:hypothetical protein C3B60_16170 [Cryobacterium zongtaii]|nr:hypothetical protein C3B60_16170 [Cryobacterium zongtaii]